MHRQRNIYQSRTLDLLRNCLSDEQDGGCKQHGQTATIWLKALLMPRLAVCSRDLHWHWINWTLLCNTMEVSMLRLAWLPIAQHVFRPALTGRLELISRKIVSRELNARSYCDFAKNIAPRLQNSRNRWAKKWGPTCVRDISNSAIYMTAIYRAYTVYIYLYIYIFVNRYVGNLQCVTVVSARWLHNMEMLSHYWPFVRESTWWIPLTKGQ